MTDILDEQAVRVALRLPMLADDLIALYSQPNDVESAPRWSRRFPNGTWVGVSKAASPSRGIVSLKISTERVDDRLTAGDSLLTLSDSSTGSLLAVMEAEALTQFRTAAMTVAIARCLDRDRPRRVALIGCGKIAEAHLVTLRETVQFGKLIVCTRNADSAHAMIERAGAASDVRIRVERDIRCGVADSQLVIAATSAHQPFLRAEWLAADAHVAAVGAYDATTAELHVDVFARAGAILVDDREDVAMAGDVAAALDAGVISKHDLLTPSLRPVSDGVTLWKSVGAANHDLIAAWHAWRNFLALREGNDTRSRQLRGIADPIAMVESI